MPWVAARLQQTRARRAFSPEIAPGPSPLTAGNSSFSRTRPTLVRSDLAAPEGASSPCRHRYLPVNLKAAPAVYSQSTSAAASLDKTLARHRFELRPIC